MEEKILKKENGIIFAQSFLYTPKGELTLTNNRLFFTYKGKEKFSISIGDILNVRAKKGVGYGVDIMIILCKQDGKEKELKLKYLSGVGVMAGQLSRVQSLYFEPWEKAIENARL